MLKVMTVFGTRPEAIKMSPVLRELEKHAEQVQSVICTTGQHRQLLRQVLELLEIKPDIELDLMEENQTLARLSMNVMRALDGVFAAEKPDIVLVQGDTTTAFIAALVGYYHGIRIGHVEAGLRTGEKYSPFPEEFNRRSISILADYNFAPTENARRNLLRENVPDESIHLTGNTVIDALFMVLKRIGDAGDRLRPLASEFYATVPSADDRKMILVTGHRRENFGEGLRNICAALKKLADHNPDIEIIYPVHLNPNVLLPVGEALGNQPNVQLISPVDYFIFVHLLNQCYFVLTDSGGVQEEAPSLGKPVLVMRDTTERPEGVEAGTAQLVGTDSERIFTEAQKLLDDEDAYDKMSRAANPYGDGRASERIVRILLRETGNARSQVKKPLATSFSMFS